MGPLGDLELAYQDAMEAALPILLPYLVPCSLLAAQAVCRCWQKATLEEPSLWTVFDIHRFPRRAASQFEDNHLRAWAKKAQLSEQISGMNRKDCHDASSREEETGARNLLAVVDVTGCVRLTGGGLQDALHNCTSLSKVCEPASFCSQRW